MPKISVIVPIYKVENYLRACIDSILNQTFTDFEIILVDDGSPDNCGKICDDYAKKDNRVHVIHQENGGLSAARNTGIDYTLKKSDSEFLLFVDSDDLIKPDLLKTVIASQEKSQADIVCFGLEMVNESLEPLAWGNTANKETIVFNHEHRFEPILPPKSIGDYAVNKMYKKSLFKNIRYPIGLSFEDVFTTYKLFNLAKVIILLPDLLYVYRRREGSITKKPDFNSKFNFFIATQEKCEFIRYNTPLFKENTNAEIINVSGFIIKIVLNNRIDNYKYYLLKIKEFLDCNWNELKNNSLCTKENLRLCSKLRKSFWELFVYYKLCNLKNK